MAMELKLFQKKKILFHTPLKLNFLQSIHILFFPKDNHLNK
jgi:hypothetical protein